MATAVMIGLAAASAVQGIVNAEEQAKAVAKQGVAEAERGKQVTLARAAKQKASFLSSGFTLEGTPLAVLTSTLDTGKADVEQGISNANTRARNIIGQSRAKALGTAASAAGSFGGTTGADTIADLGGSGARSQALARKPIF